MTNNEILRRLRYALDLDDATMLSMFSLAGATVEPSELAGLFRREEDAGYIELSDALFGRFLDGLVAHRRGVRDDPAGAARPPDVPMTNNRVLRSIRIALELKDKDVIDVLARANMRVSKSELSALFRRPDHKNYRECGDQFLRNFLQGLAKAR